MWHVAGRKLVKIERQGFYNVYGVVLVILQMEIK